MLMPTRHSRRQEIYFDAETAKRFRENVLMKGGTDDPAELYRKFRGADPDPKALLRQRGLI
jgi:peptidyl-dipeptidase Dcp